MKSQLIIIYTNHDLSIRCAMTNNETTFHKIPNDFEF